ncbi:MAG TPA: Uma2 family endonuclease [Candidatus Baltobacteraceae bacterium]|jgi:hypothetical protein|nr:Uma2 family endonuclease [Candidatus Baltobacteraceae bacterium]
MAVEYNHEPITVEKFDQMVAEGAFGPQERVELIDGAIVPLPPITFIENTCVNNLSELFNEHFLRRATVQIRGCIVLSEFSKVQPDLALLRGPARGYIGRAPNPADVILIIEAGDTTTERDRQKLSLYARSGISEFWQVDVNDGTISVYRDSKFEKTYTSPVPGAVITCAEYPSDSFSVDDIVLADTRKPDDSRSESKISRDAPNRRTAM